jgi:hypothetical protein
MGKISINMASKQFEENLINLINQSGLPEVNILFILSNMMEMAKSELGRKIAEEERQINENITERD